jgi:outer membrane protein assembly factor BamB
VVVVHADGDDVEVSAIDVTTGDAGWRQRRPRGAVQASADLVVVDRPDDELDLVEPVAVADGAVYSILVDYRADTTTLAAFDLQNGTPLWRRPLERDDSVVSLVAIDGGLVIVNPDRPEAYA